MSITGGKHNFFLKEQYSFTFHLSQMFNALKNL